MDTPRIATERLVLRPFVKADAADVFAYASNPNVSRFVTFSTHRAVADSEAYLDSVLARGADDHTWAVCLADDPRARGAIEFSLATSAAAELHYVLAEELWNRGFMTEAVQAVLAWGFATYPTVLRVTSRAMSENVASQRVMEHCGMTFERLRHDAWAKFAAPVEQREYAIHRDTWSALRKR